MLASVVVICSGIIIAVIVAYFYGAPLCARKVREALHRIGLVNALGDAPELIRHEKKESIIYYFRNSGISPKEWIDAKDSIQAVLGIVIIDFDFIDGAKTVLMKFLPSNTIPDYVEWNDTYRQTSPTTLALGIGYQGIVTVDMLKTPHIMIGGTTGSGKTILFQSLLIQAHMCGAEVFVVDPKGIDFNSKWQCTYSIYNIAHNDVEIENILNYILREIERRKVLFKEKNVSNYYEYQNLKDTEKETVKAIYLGVDEIAQIFDQTGLSKDEKKHIESIVGKVSIIARIGRAFGTYLILATQRPDANVLPGQIKGMLTVRIAGKCDDIMSQIILDNTTASREIVGFNAGRFITDDGIQFQGFIHSGESESQDNDR